MRALLEWFRAMPKANLSTNAAGVDALDKAIEWHLEDAILAAKKARWYHLRNRATIARVTGHLDAAEAALLRRAPESYLKGQIDHILAHIRFHLPKNDPRREGVETLAQAIRRNDPIDDHMREAIVRAVSIASLESRREYNNVQSFRGIILGTSALLFLGVVAVALWGAVSPNDLSLCFHPDQQNPQSAVCPVGDTESRRDILLVEAVGMLAAAVSGASTLRHISGKSGRFGLPVALTVLKLPVGALSAVLGLLLVRGNFIPGLSDLDSSEQILAWAVVLGAAQQLLTGLVDRQAVNVVGQVDAQAGK
jgi:hypothetical protein